jgi:zinc transporter ZupT
MTASLISAAVTTLSILGISRHEKWSKKQALYIISFAAGVLISAAFLHLIPESFENSARAPLFLLIGFFFLYFMNRFLDLFICQEERPKNGNTRESRGHKHDYSHQANDFTGEDSQVNNNSASLNFKLGLIPLIGIGIHSFIDGIIFAVTFDVSFLTGALAAVGLILHEFPEGIIMFVLLNQAGWERKKAITYAFLAAAVTTPLGALISYPFIRHIKPETLGLLLSLAAGALLYVGASHLLPQVENGKKTYTILTLLAGIVISFLIILLEG